MPRGCDRTFLICPGHRHDREPPLLRGLRGRRRLRAWWRRRHISFGGGEASPTPYPLLQRLELQLRELGADGVRQCTHGRRAPAEVIELALVPGATAGELVPTNRAPSSCAVSARLSLNGPQPSAGRTK
eukprot:scaffold18184_cov96-Isochrysis_galbana.AAC.1